jgi:hypothetical protein
MANPKRSNREMDPEYGPERRAHPRRPPSDIAALKSVRLIAGPEVVLIDISRRGAKFESEARLTVGKPVCIRLVAADAVFTLSGQVLRSRASSFRGSALQFTSVVVFNEDFPLLADDTMKPAEVNEPEVVASTGSEAAVSAGGVAAAPAQDEAAAILPASESTTETECEVLILTIAMPESGPDLCQLSRLNKW